MSSRRTQLIVSLNLVLALSSCATVVSVRHVTEKNDEKVCGTRYYLPQPFVVASPQSDGSLDVTVEYLPDTSQQYAVCAWSVFSAHELSLRLDQGMLSEVNWIADSSAVAAEAVKAAGEIRKTALDTQIEAAKAKQTKDETATSALQGALAGGNVPRAADVPVGPSRGQIGMYEPSRYRVAGPVMFKVVPVESRDPKIRSSVKLVSVLDHPGGSSQQVYEVYSVLPSGAATAGVPSKPLKVKPDNLGTIDVSSTPQEATLSTSADIDTRITYAFFDKNTKQPLPDDKRPSLERKSSKELTLKFTNATPPGHYEIRLSLYVDGKSTELLGQVTVPVQVR